MKKTVLRDYALYVRSKNAGPFCLTFEIFLRSKEDYDKLVAMDVVTPELISRLYGPPANEVQIFFCENINIIKISIPRPVIQGSLQDKDLHGGQQSVLLANVEIEGEE
jgi:hypothetical protein